MSAQPINVTGLEVIEHLDFEPETPCEYSLHTKHPAHPANFLVRFTCGGCSDTGILAICADVWVLTGRGRGYLCCVHCGHAAPRSKQWTIIAVLS